MCERTVRESGRPIGSPFRKEEESPTYVTVETHQSHFSITTNRLGGVGGGRGRRCVGTIVIMMFTGSHAKKRSSSSTSHKRFLSQERQQHAADQRVVDRNRFSCQEVKRRPGPALLKASAMASATAATRRVYCFDGSIKSSRSLAAQIAGKIDAPVALSPK